MEKRLLVDRLRRAREVLVALLERFVGARAAAEQLRQRGE